MFSGRAAAMTSVSLLQLLDDAIGTPEVNLNLEALRKLLKIILGHLSLLGPEDAIPQDGAQEAGARPGTQGGEGGSGTQARGTGQPGEPPGRDELRAPSTSVGADMGRMEKAEAEESGISKVEAFPTSPCAPPQDTPSSGICALIPRFDCSPSSEQHVDFHWRRGRGIWRENLELKDCSGCFGSFPCWVFSC